MKKFLLTAVILFIAGGFYYAYSTMGHDIVAVNPRHHLASVKENVKQDLSERVVEVVSSNVSSAIENVESPVGLSEDTMSGSLIHRLLFDNSQTEITSAEGNNLQADDLEEIIGLSSDDLNYEKKQEIIRIYNETPQIFNVEILKKHLSNNGYQTDYIAEVCREILESE